MNAFSTLTDCQLTHKKQIKSGLISTMVSGTLCPSTMAPNQVILKRKTIYQKYREKHKRHYQPSYIDLKIGTNCVLRSKRSKRYLEFQDIDLTTTTKDYGFRLNGYCLQEGNLVTKHMNEQYHHTRTYEQVKTIFQLAITGSHQKQKQNKKSSDSQQEIDDEQYYDEEEESKDSDSRDYYEDEETQQISLNENSLLPKKHILGIIDYLKGLVNFIREKGRAAIMGSSLFFVFARDYYHEADRVENEIHLARVKLIDLCHVEHFQDEDQRDDGFILGIQNTIQMFEELLAQFYD